MILLSVLMTVTVLFLTGCMVDRWETKTVDALVIDKEYDPPETKYKTVTDADGNTKKKRVYEPAEYEVTIKYKDIVREYEDKDLYDRVEEGDTIKVYYKEGFNEEGELIRTTIELIDEKSY